MAAAASESCNAACFEVDYDDAPTVIVADKDRGGRQRSGADGRLHRRRRRQVDLEARVWISARRGCRRWCESQGSWPLPPCLHDPLDLDVDGFRRYGRKPPADFGPHLVIIDGKLEGLQLANDLVDNARPQAGPSALPRLGKEAHALGV